MVFLAFSLRFWRLDSLPSILNRDEAALAYNAYLLQEVGQDEWGRSWPVALESFGDYKLIGYPASLVPLFSAFGAYDWVVRLPSALAGTTLVLLVFYLARQLKLKEPADLFMAGLVAFSPVFVFFSRMAFEANLALSYLVAAWLLVLLIKDQARWWHYLLLALLLVSATLTYNTPLLLIPVLMVYAWLVFPKNSRKELLLTEGVLLIVLLGVGWLLLPILRQKSGITIFTDETIWSQWIAWRSSLSGVWQNILGNRYVYYLAIMGKNLAASFSPQFLVTNGGSHPWHSLPGVGHIFAISYGLAAAGIAKLGQTVWLARKKLGEARQELGLLFLLFASLAPAVVTVDAPHATRSLLFFVILQVMAAIGAGALVNLVKKQQQHTTWLLLRATIFISGVLFARQLFANYPQQQQALQPGFDQLIQVADHQYPEQKIAIVDPAGYHYVLLAWYLKFPPNEYFNTVVRQQPDQIGFRYGEQLGRYHFIGQAGDRSPEEKILIQWSPASGGWQMESYE